VQTNDIGTLIYRIRLAKNLSQMFVCQDICSQSMLSQIENGYNTPTTDKIIPLLERMNVTMAEFEFLLLQKEISSTDYTHKTIHTVIYNFDFEQLQTLITRKNFFEYPYIDGCIAWIYDCFNISFVTTKITNLIDFRYMDALVNQDEFFSNDVEPFIFGMHTIETDALIYNYKRLCSQIASHHVNEISPNLQIIATITIAATLYNRNNRSESITYFKNALQLAKTQQAVNLTIVCLITLSILAPNSDYLNEALQLKIVFMKDNFYNYWYNVLYTKFSN